MATHIELRGDGPDRLAGVMKRAGSGWPVVARDIVEESVQTMLFVAQENAPINQGNLKNSLTTRVGLEGAGADRAIRGEVFTMLAYGEVMDLGRRPGAKPPPSNKLELWVRRKLGISDAKEIKRVAYVVARSIGKKGIKGHHFFGKALKAAERNLTKVANAALRRFEKKTLGGGQ